VSHVHKRPSWCCCSTTALEPDDDCPTHTSGEWPPRCELCGQFMKFDDEDSEAKKALDSGADTVAE